MREHRIGMLLQRCVISPRVRAAAFVRYDQLPRLRQHADQVVTGIILIGVEQQIYSDDQL